MSAMVLTFGYLAGSHMMICGPFSYGANTATSGCLAALRMASPVSAYAAKIAGSEYICWVGAANEMNGPPARISSVMSVPFRVPE